MLHAIPVARRRRCYDVSNGRMKDMRSELGEFLLEWAVVVALFVAYALFVTYALASVWGFSLF